MRLADYRFVYFLGIGGIGMSALARWFRANGYAVAGYDRTPTPLTDALRTEGITLTFDDDLDQIPEAFRADPDRTLVVLTPAIPAQHAQWAYFREGGYRILKRSQVLGLLTESLYTIGVAGTHGKTTTSSMIAHVLRQAGQNVTAFLGGITQNYGTNVLLNDPADPRPVRCVVEADEFDRSFLTLYPDLAVVTSTDADHLDIYGERGALLDSFRAYVSQIKPTGQLFLRDGLELAPDSRVPVHTYALESGEYRAENLRIAEARFVFDVRYPGGTCPDIAMRVPGFHNVENALATFAACLAVGVAPAAIRAGLESYRGVKRRFEYQLERPEVVYIDDYAHHPTEIEAFLSSVRALYPGRHLTAVFQPHLFSRTRDFHEGFAQSLSLADRLLLLDIYPAREQPMPGVTSDLIFERVTSAEKYACSKQTVLQYLDLEPLDVVVTIGAGDIDTLIQPITTYLENRTAVSTERIRI
jgi:UDP-N-acetylmuramate--alanine ligase